MAKRVNSEPIQLKNVRLSFPVLLHADKFDDSNDKEHPKFRAAFILDPTDPAHKPQIEACRRAANWCVKEAWGQKPPDMKPIDCMGDGNTKIQAATGEVYEGYADMYFISANRREDAGRPPLLYKAQGTVSTDQINDVFYGGCYVDASVDFWIQDNRYGKALRCNLRAIRFRRDGEPFGGGHVNPDSEFDDFDESEDPAAASTDFDDDLGI